MADADKQVAAEPQESSRWAVICLMACAFVAFISITLFVGIPDGSVDDRDVAQALLSSLFLFLAGLTLTLVYAMICQQGEDNDGNPKLVDMLLQL